MLLLLKALAFILGRLPRGLAVWLGKTLGAAAYKLDKKRPAIARDNIKRAFPAMPDEEAGRIAKTVFENLFVMIFEFMRLPWLDKNAFARLVEFEGREHFERALKKNKGVIIMTAHFGNWELMAVALGLFLHPMDIVARNLDNPALDEFVSWVRQKTGNRIIPKNRAMRKLLKSLSKNGVVTLLLDQNVALVEGVFIDFFGVPACTNKNPARLAVASEAAVVPVFNVRDGNRYIIKILEEVNMANTGDKELDAATNTERCTKVIEEMIRKHPDQWFWVHRRWKTRPPYEKKP